MGTDRIKQGVGLALSGGGFRATLFHLGSLWRLNELGYFPKLSEITSVSGGSIISALLGLKWRKLGFNGSGISENFEAEVANPIRSFCSRTIDVGAIVKGILSPFKHPSDYISSSYETLFEKATLQDLPAEGEGPRFTIYATSLQTGVSVRFSRPYIGEYRVGQILNPEVSLAKAVTASSAFPPVLCPVKIEVDPQAWQKWDKGGDLFSDEELKSRLLLVDGGVYDNLGLERIWNDYETVLVSDAGAPFDVETNPKLINFSMVVRTKRTLDIMGQQTGALRKRQLIKGFTEGIKGSYWGIATEIGNYQLEKNGFPAPLTRDTLVTASLSKLRTRLNCFSAQEQGWLINWGYALTDAAMRRHVLSHQEGARGNWPVREYPLGS